MTSISLLALLVVLGGLRLQLTNAAPGFAERRQELDLRDEAGSDSSSETTLSVEEKMRLIQQKLEQDGIVQFTSNGMIVRVTKEDTYGRNMSQDDENISLDKREIGGTEYSIYAVNRKTGSTIHIAKVKKTFEELIQLLIKLLNKFL